MAVRTLEQINKELSSIYNPQVNLVQQQKAATQGQVDADIEAAKGQKTMAFDEILGGARRRGLGFAGIPLGEQAQYASNVFAPTVLAAQQRGRDRALTLEEALLGLKERQSGQAQQLRRYDVEDDRWERQFAEQRRQYEDQLEASKRAAAARGGGGGFNLAGAMNSGGLTKGGATAGPNIPKGLQTLYNQVFVKGDGGMWGDRDLVNDYNSTFKSAQYGNTRDKQKLELYHSVRPDLFGAGMPSRTLSNSQKLRF